MSIFSGLFRSRDKPRNRTAGSAYSFYMGGTTSYRGSDEALKSKDFSVRLEQSDVLHIPGLGFDGLVGYRPIEMAGSILQPAYAGGYGHTEQNSLVLLSGVAAASLVERRL